MKPLYKIIILILALIIVLTLKTGYFFGNNSSSANTYQGTYNNNAYYIIQFPEDNNIRDLFDISAIPDYSTAYAIDLTNGDTALYSVCGYNLKSGNSIVACEKKKVFIYYEGKLTQNVLDGLSAFIIFSDDKSTLPYSVGEKYFKDDLK